MGTGSLYNNTLNNVYPPQATPPLPDKEARDYALEALKAYICSLIFQRTNAPGLPPIPFQLPPDSVQIEQPDDIEDLAMPGIGIIPGRAVSETYGLGPPVILDKTEGIAGPGTALQRQGDHVESIIIEAWATKKAERRALAAGIKAALRASDGSSSIYLHLPNYWGMTAGFELDETLRIDGDEVSRNRRRAHVFVTMRICEVALTNVRTLNTTLDTTVLDGNVFLTLDC